MDYEVTEYEGVDDTSFVAYESVPLSSDSVFDGVITTADEQIQTCTLTSDDEVIEPDEIFLAQEDMISGVNVKKTEDGYTVSTDIQSQSQPVTVACALYAENGKMLRTSLQEVNAGVATADLTLPASEKGSYLKVFLLSLTGTPIDDCITVGL